MISRALPASFLLVAALGSAAPPAAAQLTVLEPGFRVKDLGSGAGAKQVECSPGGIWGEYVYIADSEAGSIERIDPDDAMGTFGPSLAFPVGLSFGPGPAATFGDFLYVTNFDDNTIRKIDPSGAVAFFATFPAPGAGAFDPTGAYGNDLFVSTAFIGPVYTVDPSGASTFFSPVDAAYLKFGPGGAWGTGLYATTNGGGGVGTGIAKVDAAGTPAAFVTGLSVPEGFDWAMGGAFGDDLFATDFAAGEIWRVKPDGTRTLWATLPDVADVSFCNGALYVVSGSGACYKVTEPPIPVERSSWGRLKALHE